jgi:dipeptidyl aminopeptidase/acylaminoacyl peptidase
MRLGKSSRIVRHKIRSGSAMPGWCFLTVLSAITLGAPALAENGGLTPEQLAKVKRVIDVQMSPDGQHVAYRLLIPRIPFKDDDGSAWIELHVVNPAGASRPFITGKVNVGSMDWTPDGSGISFLAKRGDDKETSLYVIPIDGGEARKVLEHETGVGQYTWSPKGHQVAFIAKEKDPERTKKLKDKGFKQEIYEEEWRLSRVWIADIEKGNEEAAEEEENKPRMLELPGQPSEMHWSPKGDHLALALAPRPLIDDHYMHRKIRIVDVESGDIVAKIDHDGKLGQMAWSPDGRHLAFIGSEDMHDPAEGRLMLARIEPSDNPIKPKELLPDFMGHVTAIAWQDAENIMYLADIGVWTTLAKINLNGSRRQLLPEDAYVLNRLSLSRNGQSAAMLGNSTAHPSEVFIMSHGESAPRRVTDSNPWLEDVRLARQEVVTYKARDGLEIQGLLIYPLDYDDQAGKRYPLIIDVHGGPEANYHNGWITRYASPGQVAAARGYAVFYPNYRGSTGRGVAFSKMGQSDYAGKEFDDLVDAVDHLVEMGLADKDRVGVTGGSYGGFASAWCATYHTKRFAASVMFVGVSNHLSKFGTTDIPDEMYLVHSRKYPWQDWDYFVNRSPVRYTENARTPILILHGKDDPRVHPAQSMELYRFLKVLDKVPVRLVYYPGEGHGNRKAGAQYDYNLRMMRWFDHYLMGPGGEAPPHELEYPLEPKKDENGDDEDKED